MVQYGIRLIARIYTERVSLPQLQGGSHQVRTWVRAASRETCGRDGAGHSKTDSGSSQAFNEV